MRKVRSPNEMEPSEPCRARVMAADFLLGAGGETLNA